MLGVVENPLRTPVRRGDGAGRRPSMGVGDTFHPTPVGVFFGGPGQAPGETVADPYFGGAGPDAQHLHRLRRVHDRLPAQRQEHPGQELPLPRRAERRAGAAAHHGHPGPRRATGGGYDVHVRFTKAKTRPALGATRTLTAEQVVFAASALGTQRLLHRMKRRGPPAAALRRGSATCRAPTPSRSSARSRPDTKVDYSQGVAITSSFHPDEHTHIEPVRYGKGSNAMSLMQTVLTDGDGPAPRWRTWLKEMWKERAQRPRPLRRQALVRAHRDRAGDAEPRQLDHGVLQAQPRHRALAPHLAAGPRRARTRPGSRSPTRPSAGWPRSSAARRAARSASRSTGR